MPYTNLVVGLTGGIGSGKSTVADLFAKHGVTIIDTDKLARDLTEINTPALQHIAKKFGVDILSKNKALDRKALRKIVFANAEHRVWLENLLHPLIRSEMKRLIQLSETPYTIVVIPLLLEGKPNSLIDRILVVDTAEELQMKRTQARDNHTPTEVEAIMKAQIMRCKRLAHADDIITNDGELTDLIPQVDKLHEFYLSLCEPSTSSG